MIRRGQSTVEPMIAITVLLLALVVAGHVWHPQFMELMGWIFDEVGKRVELP